jgi:glycine/D-amino acid oxidase-like deaminating enzyme
MTATSDVVVIGAGIVGAACAHMLAREKLSVTVVEPAVVGGGATAAGMGHIVVMDDSEPQFALTKYSRDLWDALIPELPPEAEYERRGTLWVAADEEEMAAVYSKAAYYHERDVRAVVLSEAELRSAEPNLRRGLAGALLIPDDGVVYAPFVAQWLLSRATRIERRAPVSAVARGSVQLSNGDSIQCKHVVCAAGAWATALFPDLPIRPRKGHLAITDRYPGFVHHQLVELGYLKSAHGHSNESVAFNIQPRATGQVLIGSSRQYGEERSRIDAPILSRMLARAIEYMPSLAQLSVIRTWTGFRAATEDKLPLLGPVDDGIYLATGHEGLGITTSLGSAALITDMLLEQPPTISAGSYLPSRLHA